MRRSLVVLLLASVSAIACLPCAGQDVPKRGPVQVSDEALKLHHSALLFDGHNDLPYQCNEQKDRFFQRLDIARPQPTLHTDIARLRKGGVGAQFWVAYVPAETAKTGTAVKDTVEQIDLIHRMVNAYPDTFELALNADDGRRIRKAGQISAP